ncbi:MAG: stress response translation initiation inhibitor YciH [Nanoarchaeota archaeon]|nr:stress response translation initiation inhibitor YciH [Nanoarchaeota archaeon]
MDKDEFGLPTEADVFEEIAKSDQQIKVSLVTRRYGKKITLVEGFDKQVDVKAIAKNLKEGLACGGTVKNSTIELQGDHKKKVKPILVKIGFSADAISD